MTHQLKANSRHQNHQNPERFGHNASLTGEASLKHKNPQRAESLPFTEARTKNTNCRRIVGLPLTGRSKFCHATLVQFLLRQSLSKELHGLHRAYQGGLQDSAIAGAVRHDGPETTEMEELLRVIA